MKIFDYWNVPQKRDEDIIKQTFDEYKEKFDSEMWEFIHYYDASLPPISVYDYKLSQLKKAIKNSAVVNKKTWLKKIDDEIKEEKKMFDIAYQILRKRQHNESIEDEKYAISSQLHDRYISREGGI